MTKIDWPEEVQQVWLEIELERHERNRREVMADPEAYKLTTYFPEDGEASYRYFESKRGKRMRPVHYCWSTNRNLAGYFLSWREREIEDGVWKRDQWSARKVRKKAKALALARFQKLEERRGRR